MYLGRSIILMNEIRSFLHSQCTLFYLFLILLSPTLRSIHAASHWTPQSVYTETPLENFQLAVPDIGTGSPIDRACTVNLIQHVRHCTDIILLLGHPLMSA